MGRSSFIVIVIFRKRVGIYWSIKTCDLGDRQITGSTYTMLLDIPLDDNDNVVPCGMQRRVRRKILEGLPEVMKLAGSI